MNNDMVLMLSVIALAGKALFELMDFCNDRSNGFPAWAIIMIVAWVGMFIGIISGVFVYR